MFGVIGRSKMGRLSAYFSTHALRCGTAAALALAVTNVCSAQTRPNQRPENDRDRDMRQEDSPRYGRDARNGEYPTSDVHTAVEANARMVYARANYRRMQDSLTAAIRQMQYNFEHSPELMEAQKNEQRAWEDYVAARNSALKNVINDPKYQANLALKNDMGEKIAEVRSAYDTPRARDMRLADRIEPSRMKQIVMLATVKLDYAQVVTDMEVTALKADSGVSDTRSKLMAAGARVQAIRDNFERTTRNSSDLAALRGKIDDARIALITSEAFRDGAVDAANQALDYTYYKNRFGGNVGSYEYGYYTGYR
jgi:hypothetical protein